MYDFDQIALVWRPRCEAEITLKSTGPGTGAMGLADRHLATENSWANRESVRQETHMIQTDRQTGDTHEIDRKHTRDRHTDRQIGDAHETDRQTGECFKYFQSSIYWHLLNFSVWFRVFNSFSLKHLFILHQLKQNKWKCWLKFVLKSTFQHKFKLSLCLSVCLSLCLSL